jgi:spore coat polysaccharide biosynthesis protein SpsF
VKKAVIIQARMSSSRLPGKVLKQISNGETIIGVLLTRLKELINNEIDIIVATSDSESDDILVNFLSYNYKWVKIFRGSLDNVLQRYSKAADFYGIDTIIRITSDCPFTDPLIILEMLNFFGKDDYDYISNTMPPDRSTFSDGFDVEIFSKNALKRLAGIPEITAKDKEHVTFLFWKSNYFKTGLFVNCKSPNYQFKLSVDTIDDFRLIDSIVAKIGTGCTYSEIEEYLCNNSHLQKINENSKKNSGWKQ